MPALFRERQGSSRSLAGAFAARGVRVHTMLPGFVETEGFPQKTALQSRFFRRQVKTPEALVERIVKAIEPQTSLSRQY